MGNRHGGEKASREEKEEKKRKKKEKKAKKKAKKKGGAAGSDVDLDPESSQFSCADSESLAFHSAENLSPYLDASTRSEEGAACVGFYDNGHILSSKDFHDGFSIEACLPADLAASALMCDLASDVSKGGEDVTSMASGVYSTPLLSSPDVRRGIPRSPLAQRQKDSFVEPVPPIPSDFSSNTLSSVSYQEGVSTPGTQRSSSRASSSTVDTNAAHCIERLEELERNIERTIIERFAPLEPSATSGSENTTPRLIRRAEFLPEDRSREGSMTPRGIASDGGLAQSPETSPPIIRKISEPCRPTAREGSCTPVGVIHGVWSQSAENSPVIVRRALPNPESPIILRRTPSQSPSVERKFPANALESPVFYRRTVTNTESSGLSPSTQRRPPPEAQERSPQLIRRAAPELESSGSGSPQKSKVPPPVPPKPIMKTLTSPEIARRLQNMPKSPIMARKVYAFQEQQQTKEKNAALKDDPWDRSWREHQMPPKSPSRSPEVRHRVTRKTPSSSPSPKSLVRKLIPPEDRAPPPVNTPPPCPQSQVQFCQQQKGIPVKHCTVGTQPSAAVVLDMRAPTSQPAESKPSHAPPPSRDTPSDKSSAVSEDSIKKSTATAVFGSVSPKLKRQKKIQSGDDSSQSSCYDPQRGDSTDSSTRSPPCSPPVQRGRPVLDRTVVKDSEGSDHSPTRGPLDTGGQSPGRSRAQLQKQDSKCGTDDGALSADIAGGLTYHAYLHDVTATHPLRDRVGEHLDNVHHYPKTTHQYPESAVQTPTVHTDRSQIEGHSDFQTGSFSPSTPPYPHPTTTPPQSVSPPTDKAISQSAVIAGSTVLGARNVGGEGEAGGRGGGGYYYTGTQHLSAREAERSHACRKVVGESEQRVPSSCQQHHPPSPPPPPPPPVGRGGGGGGRGGRGGGGGSSSSGKALRTNLGQRIRDVINESSSVREVFTTAELSPSSSVEKDDGTYYTSDDSVFTTHGAPPHPHPKPHPYPPPTTTTTPSPLSFPPTTHERVVVVAVLGTCWGGGGGGRTTSPPYLPEQGSNPGQPPAPPLDSVTLPLQPHPSPALDTTAIRRIDIDVNVVLPEGGYHEGGTLFPLAGQSGSQWETGGGQGMTEAGMMDAGMNPDPDNAHSSHAEKTGTAAKTCLAENQDKTEAGSSRKAESSVLPPPPPPSTTTTTEDRPKPQPPPVMEVARGSSEGNVPRIETVKNASSYKKGEQPSQEVMSDVAPPASFPISAPGSQTVSGEREGEGESVGGGVGLASERKSSTEGLLRQEGKPTRVNTDSAQPCVSGSEPASGQESKPAPSSHHPELSNTMQADEAQQDPHPAADEAQQDPHPASSQLKNVHQTTTDTQAAENILQDSVPPPSPTAMDVLAEEEEEEEEEVNSMINAHHDSDISSKISQEMQMFGETVVKRLSSFLESQASESDSCLEESRSDLLTVPGSRHKKLDEDPNGKVSSSMAVSRTDQTEAGAGLNTAGVVPESVKESSHKVKDPPVESSKEDIEPVLREELNTFSTSDLPGERLVTSDTTETLSTDHDTSASSKRESTTSTATDETLTSFKTRSTTDSAEFEDAFILPESLVFVRSVSEGVEGGAGAMVETGRIIKRPPIPAELTRHSAAAQEPSPHKPRKKRRRQVGTYDVSARADVTEPEPKRGSKQIQEVIDAYCEGTSDDSDISSSADDILSGEVVRRATFTRSEHQPRLPTSADREQKARDTVRKPQTSTDRDTDSSDESTELEAKRQSSSSHDSSLRIPEIEETFGELMGVKTLLEDLEDKPPTTSEAPPVQADLKDKPPTTSEAPPVQAEEEEEKIHAKEFLLSAQHRRRSKTSPARTDRTESDLDVSEHRDDASTDSMYADDEDEGNEVVFQRSYSEEHGGEVVLSCTIYNSSRDNGADSDEFWADAEAAAAADESYKSLETAADAAGSAFQNARIQMHDIHQHLQDLRRQMEMLQDDITSTSLTLTPDFSLESEQRPVTE